MIELVPEEIVEGKRLGRFVNHDERSRNFLAPRAATLTTKLHRRVTPILDQGGIGACTGFAMAGLLGTEPFATPGKTITEGLARALYSLSTQLDPFPGTWPPTDSGSDGLSVAKAAQQVGLITSYQHAFGLQHALEAIVRAPCIAGFNWYDSFDRPSSTGYIEISPNAGVRGAHEVELPGVVTEFGMVQGVNSWGPSYAVNGYFYMSYGTFERLLHERGDVTTVTR